LSAALNTFVEAAGALIEIRDSKLYRDTFDTFEDYWRERWQMSRFYAYRLMDAAEVSEALLPIGNIPRHVGLLFIDPRK
jgi:hypothetical protein